MIVGQLALCEECRDGSCARCKRFKTRKSRALRAAAKKAGLKVVNLRITRLLTEDDVIGLPELP